jgi:putative transposase
VVGWLLADAESKMAHFRTLKYRHEHYHSGVAWLHPVDVHYGRAETVRAVRAEVLDAAYARNPDRFVNKPPQPAELPTAARINRPPKQTDETQTAQSMNP